MTHEPIYSPADLRRLEQQAEAAGCGLMQQAAEATVAWIRNRFSPGAAIRVVAGPGNNGGDALWAAVRLAEAGYRPQVVCPRPSEAPTPQAALSRLLAMGLPVWPMWPDALPAPALVVDGLFGIGLARPLAEPWSTLVRAINAAPAPVLALDVPSGIDAWTGRRSGSSVVRAHATLTFLCAKPGLHTSDGADLAGEVDVARLQVPASLLPSAEGALIDTPQDALPLRPRNSHKGRFGSVLVIGAAPGMAGAGLLAGTTALACGAGKVWLLTLDPTLTVSPTQPELMIRPLNDSRTLLDEAAVCAAGPGLGTSVDAASVVAAAVDRPGPLVLDADALNLLAAIPSLAEALAQRALPAVLTPHPAEAARLLGCTTAAVQHDRVAAARTLAARYHALVVLKGAGSLIMRPDGFYHVCPVGSPALASAGQGDVLTGVIAALLAQGLSPFDAASLAVWLHAMAGRRHEDLQGPVGLRAGLMGDRVAEQMNRLYRQRAASQPVMPPPLRQWRADWPEF